MLRIIRHGRSRLGLLGPVYATIGNFDGVHLGHAKIIERLNERYRQDNVKGTLAVVSFFPHPSLIVKKNPKAPLITTLRQKIKILESLGIHNLILIKFTRPFSKMSAKDFLQNILFKELDVSFLAIGPDARIGHKGLGTADFITGFFTKAGRSCETVPFKNTDGKKVSSREIRLMVESGSIEQVRNSLGRNFSLDGRVVKGDCRGRTLGFPTANLSVSKRQVLPNAGVYATISHLSGQKPLISVTNVGKRPTFGLSKIVIETHIPDFIEMDLYRKRLEVEFVACLRDEVSFKTVQELKTQIKKDIETTKSLLRFHAQ